MRRLLIASLALIACGGAASALTSNPADPANNEARIERALKGLTPGKPVNCIPHFRPNYTTETIGDAILYKVNNRLVYRNDTTGGCRTFSGFDILIVNNVGAQLCSGTIIRTVDPLARVETGGCALGRFTPYTKAK